ncbi:putative THIOREDOXIN PROTEIN [Cupriavidus taiwanensis]|uniref:Thioredoxin n=1 Tax=Cupriavidus taiwanensis TaxID=164546 RepID=A0A976AW56_9BURK|nr:thioredoxin [Cupriavidus taiwanensis]SOZ55011.1 putative THIOREDOXIN PROTEIN [Cupriavidus taiwanensis]SOZ55965.1 putative THIOREDOXIN PROTEIN [Cupriavidus taiwanensis]SOZ58722.1 putative THIOREDOXIN PROTEIN [Cupriavidus taiwanensis]SPA05255.1 putative THIOREDOXIN PROTEIN [Cupriavidus taiwanensis]
MSDVTLQNFETEVIDASRQMPVLVDFWAPWCGPCRTLGPMLERLEAEADGQWKLVKVNVDENQELAAHFGVRSIPHVVAIDDGQAVDQFTGVLPESGLREFLSRLAPGQARSPLADALALAAAGNRDGAETLFADAIAADPESDAPRLAYISFLLDGNAVDRARAEFAALSPRAEQEDGYGALRTRIDAMENAAGLPDAATLARRIDADPRDLAARMDLARLMIAQQQYEPALEQLLAIVRTDRGFDDDIGRRTMLSVFEMLADRPEVVSRWRRQLSTSLN